MTTLWFYLEHGDNELPEAYNEVLSSYEINRVIGEIPSAHKYDDLRFLMQCQDVQTSVDKVLLSEDTPKQLLLRMLK